MPDQMKIFLITWQDGRVEEMQLTQYQADNMKDTSYVKSVEEKKNV